MAFGSPMPSEFEEVYLCDTLGITYTELQEQPYEWIMQYLSYIKIRNKHQEQQQKSAK
jgi:hypothetical protein